MSFARRVSISEVPAVSSSPTSMPTSIIEDPESAEWLKWTPVLAKDLIDSPLFTVDGEDYVEKACEILLAHGTSCLAVKAANAAQSFLGLFDYADVNAFLVLAVDSNTLAVEDADDTRVSEIVAAAKAGGVPVRLASDLSDKNPLVVLPPSANLLSLLRVFSRGTHRVVIENASGELEGIVSDRRLTGWFMSHAPEHPALAKALATPLNELGIGSKNVISLPCDATILDAMRLMSEQGVSSIAVVNADGTLLSAVSVTDVGKLVVPSQSKKILSTTLSQFIAQIKEPDGSTDGVDKYPVFSVSSTSTLSYTMQKLLATNAHRVFITDDPTFSSGGVGNLRGVVSVVDVLSVFACLAGLPDVDPGRMQRHRRASSTSSSRSSSFSRSDPGSLRSSVSSIVPPHAEKK